MTTTSKDGCHETKGTVMAKEEIHKYLRTFLALACIVFAGGGYTMKISDNSKRIEKSENKISECQQSVVDIKINQERQLAQDKAMLDIMTELKADVGRIVSEQSEIKAQVVETQKTII